MWQHLLGDQYNSPNVDINTQSLLRKDETDHGDDDESSSKATGKSLNFNEVNYLIFFFRYSRVHNSSIKFLGQFRRRRKLSKRPKAM